MICERCGNSTHSLEPCTYCGKNVCRLCENSSKRIDKIKRYFICKSCWSVSESKKAFKRV
ncbi:MAG: hypothetical protein NT157_03390 [Candidatus Micrarchaeota archaeon]|nr:hypothetical protein [Candidatus Micrarchaeota archaeon]